MANGGGGWTLLGALSIHAPISPLLPVSLLRQPSVHLRKLGSPSPSPSPRNTAYHQEVLVCKVESGSTQLRKSPLLQLQDVALG